MHGEDRMSDLEVLDFVLQEMQGRMLTASCMSAFVAAERAANSLEMGLVSRQAAELAVMLPKAPIERVKEAFGESVAEIASALRRKSVYSKIAIEAMSLYGRSSNNRVPRDAAIAAIAAEIAVASAEDREVLVNALDFISGEERDASRRAFVEELRGRLPSHEATKDDEATEDDEAGRNRRTRVISISMDVCGSTDVKARMRQRARGHRDLNRWYAAFHREFLEAEWHFYESLFRPVHGDVNWDWKRAFVVKGIGDEIWLLYEVWEEDDDKLPALVACLLHAAQDATGRLIRWMSATEEDEGDEDGDEPWERNELPLKFYVDIIDDAFEITGPRRDFMTKRLSLILGEEDAWAGEDFVELGNRLHAGSLLGDGRRLVTAIRTDYIGWEVDRFFRMTKYALPYVVAIGRNLFEEAVEGSPDDAEGIGGTELCEAVFACPFAKSLDMRFDRSFGFVKEEIDGECLKGVGEGYAVYRVMRKHELLGLRHTGADEEVMKDTYKVFTKEMEDAVRASLQA